VAHGGAREGSGRKPGQRNAKTVEQVERIEASGLTPLDYMLSIMRDIAVDDARRLDAAKSAAPYVHARLSSVEAKVEGELVHTVKSIERVVVDPAANPDS